MEERSFVCHHFTKAAAVFFSTVTTHLLLKNIPIFAHAETTNQKERSLFENQQVSSILNYTKRSQLSLGSPPNDILLYNQYALIATQDIGLQVVDVSNRSNPIIVGNYKTIYNIRGSVYPIHQIAVTSHYAYLAEDMGGLRILDISNPTAPVAIGAYYTSWPVAQVRLLGNRAWLVDGSDALNFAIIDVSQPEQVLKNRIFPISNAADMVIHNNTAYIAATSSLVILNITNPAASRFLGYYEFTSPPSSTINLCVNNDVIYLMTTVTTSFINNTIPISSIQLTIINATNPSALTLSGNYSYNNYLTNLAFIEKQNNSVYLYLINGSLLEIVDASHQPNPVSLGTVSIPGNFYIRDIVIEGDMGYLIYASLIISQSRITLTNQGVYLVNMSDLTQPKLLGNYTNINTKQITIQSGLMYLWNPDLVILNISDPTQLTLLNGYPPNNMPGPFSPKCYDCIHNGIAYVVEEYIGDLQIINVTQPSNASLTGVYVTCNTYVIDDVGMINDQLIYLLDDIGLQLLNVTDHSHPRLLRTYKHTYSQILIKDNVAFLLDNGLIAINIATLDKNLLEPFKYSTGNRIQSMQIDYEQAGLFVLYSNLGLTWLSSLSINVTAIPVNYCVSSLCVNDQRMIYAGYHPQYFGNQNPNVQAGIQVINAANLSKPQMLGNARISGWEVFNMIFSDDIVFMNHARQQVFNVSNPVNPIVIANYSLNINVLVINSYLAYAAKSVGVEILNVSNWKSIQQLSNFSFPQVTSLGNSHNLVLKNGIIYTAYAGLYLINASNIFNLQLLSYYSSVTGRSIIVEGHIAYVCGDGLQIVDVSQPRAPMLLSNNLGIGGVLITIKESTLYLYGSPLPGMSSHFQAFDVADPTNPELLGEFRCEDVNRVVVSSMGSFYLGGNDGVYVLSCASKAFLWDSRLPIQSFPYALVVGKNYSYVVDSRNILHVIDTFNKSNITEIATNYQFGNRVSAMIAVDDFLYVAEKGVGIKVIDIYYPALPVLATQLANNLTEVEAIIYGNRQLYVVDAIQGLHIYDIQGEPSLMNHHFTLIPGMNLLVTTAELSARDTNPGSNSSQLIFIVASLQNGRFELVSQPNVSVTNFTQQDITSRNVLFIPVDMILLPSFQISVSNGLQTTNPQYASVILNTNIPPQIITNKLVINQGETVTLTHYDLRASSINSSKLLTFTTNKIKNGRFQVNSTPGVFVTIFSPQNISERVIQFVATGKGLDIPSYEVIVSDGVLSSLPSTVNVSYNAAPQIVMNQLTMAQGTTVTLSANDLSAIDVDDDNANLFLTISGVQYGSFNQLNFTQQILWNGQIQFTQDGTSQTPIYYVNVSDGKIQVGPQKAITNLSNNLTPIIAGATVGGGFLLATAIGAGFWFRKRNQDYNTRNQHRFANYIREALKLKGIDNFKSTKGQRYVSVIQRMTQELFNQGLDVNQRSDYELKAIANNVATASKNKITHNTSCFGYSEIKIDDIDRKIPMIAQEVLRLQAGLDDSEIQMSEILHS